MRVYASTETGVWFWSNSEEPELLLADMADWGLPAGNYRLVTLAGIAWLERQVSEQPPSDRRNVLAHLLEELKEVRQKCKTTEPS